MKFGMILIFVLCLNLPVPFLNAAQDPDKWETHREDVRMIQKLLKKQGYHPGTSDGRMGPRTESAVRAYQTDKHLSPDGEITEELVNHILSHVSIPADFFIDYNRKSLFSEGTTVTINANGQYLVTPASPDPRNPSPRILAKGCLSPARIKTLYVQLLSCGVFNKQNQKENSEPISGGKGSPTPLNDSDTTIIHITANGKSGIVRTPAYCVRTILKTADPSIEKYIR